MAQPDLTSQKLMNTNPDQGYGDSVVLPYRPRGLDYNPHTLIGANQDRMAKERAVKADRDLKMLADFGKVSDETKGNPELQYKRGLYAQEFGRSIDEGQYIPKEKLAAAEADLQLYSAVSKDEKKQFDNEITTVIPSHAAFYGDAYNKGLAAFKATKGEKGYWTTGHGQSSAESDPTKDPSLYDAQTAVKDFAKDFKVSTQTNENAWDNPEKAGSKKTTAGALFMVSDPENPGRMKIGVGQQHIDALLAEKNGVLQKKLDQETILPLFKKDAEEISRLSKIDIKYSQYATMTPDQIEQDLIANGNPLRKGEGGVNLNVAGFRNQMAKQMLEVHNNKTQGLVESNETKSAIDNSSGGSASTNVIATPGEMSHAVTESTPTYATDPITKKVQRVKTNMLPGVIDGVYFKTKKGANGAATDGLTPFTGNFKNIRNQTTGEIIPKSASDPTFTINHAGFALVDPQGAMIKGPNDVTIARLNQLADEWKKWHAGGGKGAEPSTFGKYAGQDVASGFTNEKVNVENDEANQKKAKETGGTLMFMDDEEGKKISVIRYAVQIPFTKQDGIGSHIDANTNGNYYNRTNMSPREKALRDAWNKYTQSVSGY